MTVKKLFRWIRLIFLVALAGKFCSVKVFGETDSSLIGHWPFSEGQGTISKDISTSRNDAKIVGATWSTGGTDSALEFDGIDDYVVIPHRAEFNLEDNITLSCWVYPFSTAGEQGFISKGRSHFSSGYNFLSQDGKLVLMLMTEQLPGKDIKGMAYTISSAPVLKENLWSYVAATYNTADGKACIYLNGEAVKEAETKGRICYLPASDLPYPTLPVAISTMAAVPAYPYWKLKGFIREVKIHDRALTGAEIKAEYLKNSSFFSRFKVESREETLRKKLTSRLSAKVIDADTGKPLDCKAFIRGSDGNYHYPFDSFHYGARETTAQFYVFDGGFELDIPHGKTELTLLRGFEYEPEKLTLEIKDGEKKEITIRLKRFADFSSFGWYCGDHQIQYLGHGVKQYDGKFTPESASRICAGEGLNFAVWTNPSVGGITDAGKRPEHAAAVKLDGFISQPGFEPRDVISGAVSGFGVREYPKWGLDRLTILEDAEKQGGIALYNYPYTGKLDDPNSYMFGREVPCDVALGKLPIWDVSCGGVQEKDWFRYLNLGFRLAASTSSDAYMNSPSELITPGCSRTYAKLSELSFPDIVKSYREGKTFVTNGPLLLFGINGKGPGETVSFSGDKPENLGFSIEACHLYGIDRIELIRNGEVIKTIPGEGEKKIKNSFSLKEETTCWFIVKCYGRKGEFFGNAAFTSPIYVQFGSRKMQPKREDAEYFIDWIKRTRKLTPEYLKLYNFPEASANRFYEILDAGEKIYRSMLDYSQ